MGGYEDVVGPNLEATPGVGLGKLGSQIKA